VAAALRLPPATTRRISARHDIAVPARDGVRLLTDHYAPAVGSAPTVLVRTPYGRRGGMGLLGRVFAERGFHVVVQSCRGTFGSTGTFEPLLFERADGMDTLAWLRRQPWYSGEFGMFGASYLGFVQWAIAADAGDELKAMVAVVTASQMRDSTYAGGAFALDTILTWAELINAQSVPWWSRQVELKRGQPRLRAGLGHLPLNEADRVATGQTVPFYQEWLRHTEPGVEYWLERMHDRRVARVTAPVAMVTGWHDIFLPAQLDDYLALRAAGRQPYLSIGPWTHGSLGLFRAALHEGLAWFRAHMQGDHSMLREAPVRVQVVHDGGWRELSEWPPDVDSVEWYFGAGGTLGPHPPAAESTPDSFRYDPADPTPSLGGPLLVAQRAGQVENGQIEARPDVLTYTGTALRSPIEVVGPVEAMVYVQSELADFDVFVRLCDVDGAGRSWNVCDGLTRVTAGGNGAIDGVPGDGVLPVRVRLWPAAYRFRPGHRIRVQVSGGAHPRYARNPGTGEPLGTARKLRAGRRRVFHDARYPSAILLPIDPA
jgi:putative CocE/NonD family hydrolase